MEHLPIYLLAFGAIFAFFAIIAARVIFDKRVNDGGGRTFVEEYVLKKQAELKRSKTGITVGQYFAMAFGLPIAMGFVAYFISDNRTMIPVFMALGAFLPTGVIQMKQITESGKFEERFIRALAQMAASLHSGFTVEQAIDSVVDCELLHPSIREDFMRLSSKMKLGVSIDQAFSEFADETGSKDAKDVAIAITIMTEIGGDAGEAIEKIQKNVESRLLYRQKRKSMMAESKLISIFSDALPFVILAGTYVVMPGTIQAYFESPMMTVVFLGILAILMFGSVVVHRMLNNKIDAS